MTDKICSIREEITKHNPLIHCITNPISINQCANAILSVGAKPIMAEHPEEVSEITDTADALMLNLGNITDARMKSIAISLERAKERGIPSLFDVVGVACSKMRREYALSLLKRAVPSVVKGNYSEIEALYNQGYSSAGVDADNKLNLQSTEKTAKELALKYKTVILATGETDIVTNGERILHIKNGTEKLSSVTGTGCMLGALCTAFLSVLNPLNSAVLSCVYFGICGEMAETKKGSGSFMVNLMDRISTLSREEILKNMDLEERK